MSNIWSVIYLLRCLFITHNGQNLSQEIADYWASAVNKTSLISHKNVWDTVLSIILKMGNWNPIFQLSFREVMYFTQSHNGCLVETLVKEELWASTERLIPRRDRRESNRPHGMSVWSQTWLRLVCLQIWGIQGYTQRNLFYKRHKVIKKIQFSVQH